MTGHIRATPAHLVTYSPTHLVTYSPTHLLTYPHSHTEYCRPYLDDNFKDLHTVCTLCTVIVDIIKIPRDTRLTTQAKNTVMLVNTSVYLNGDEEHDQQQ